MSGNNKNDADKVSLEIPETRISSPVTQLKSSKRDEFLTKLTSLITLAYKEGSDTSVNERIRQRWCTICGYLAQVAARVVTDLEYERLRDEVDEMKRRVQNTNVIRPRRTTYPGRARFSRKIAPKSNTGSSTRRPS